MSVTLTRIATAGLGWLFAAALALIVAGCSREPPPPAATAPAPRAEPDLPPANPERNAYFGDLHLHTSYSTDAFLLMTRTTPDDAYRFAKGEAVEYLGRSVQRRAPLDFLAVTDHAEYLGVVRVAAERDGPLRDTRWGRWLAAGTAEGSAAAFQALLAASGDGAKIPEFEDVELRKRAWTEYAALAEKHYQPGRFTTFVAFEWSAAPGNQNLHRNVIFRGDGPDLPFSSKESNDPERLWDYMDRQRAAGRVLLAIPHNGNASNGLMFNTETTLAGAPLSREYLERRLAHEPLTEIAQVKGQSETHPLLSPNDEFARFELYEYLIGVPKKANFATGSYVRQAYGTGQVLNERFGVNPFKLGLVGGTDFHSGVTANEEFNYPGSHGNQDGDRTKTLTATSSIGGEPPVRASAAALTGVWAERNTRESIYDAIARKETFATSGVRLKVRLFGGWNLPDGLVAQPDWVRRAYELGVPMGADLPPAPPGGAPTFIVHALKDPDSGNLDRIQLVKVATRHGKTTERIVDVVWWGENRLDRKTGRLRAIASDGESAGATELVGMWTDREFDPAAQVTYYARVLEAPTLRWSTRWAAEAGLPPPKGVPTHIQERAWTSPIWYAGSKR